MPEHIQYEDDDLFNPETHHEHSDVPVRPLLQALVIFIVFAVITHFLVKFLYDRFASAESKRMDPPHTLVARPPDVYVPKNQPLLQPFPRAHNVPPNAGTPVVDLIELRAAEDQKLHSYGWTDQQHGVVHIPIEAAKAKFVAMSGAPASPPADAAASTPPPPAGGTQQ
ncbi:MAG TPA: hypothetical protein VJZ00_05890 [Thermoanaerobaculia bacterium]|nr:hypothetical protein [Thermoanaerobaculia bacterium]